MGELTEALLDVLLDHQPEQTNAGFRDYCSCGERWNVNHQARAVAAIVAERVADAEARVQRVVEAVEEFCDRGWMFDVGFRGKLRAALQAASDAEAVERARAEAADIGDAVTEARRVREEWEADAPTVLDLDDPYFHGQTLPDALADYEHVHSATGVCVKNVAGLCASQPTCGRPLPDDATCVLPRGHGDGCWPSSNGERVVS